MSQELEHIKKKRNEELQKTKHEEEIKTTLRIILDETAYGRMMNIRIASPEFYMNAVEGCISVYQRVRRKLSDGELLIILRRLKGMEKETKITFERK